jgi:hypothetical protein
MPKTIGKLLAAAAAALLAASMGAQAAPFFTNQAGNVVLNQATGRVWMRCSLGQTWQDSNCTGNASLETFEGAQKAAKALNAGGGYAGANDWQVPTVLALASLRYCSTGFATGIGTNVYVGQTSIDNQCESSSVTPTIDIVAFPGSQGFPGQPGYWTSQPSREYPFAYTVQFFSGYVSGVGHIGDSKHVRLVRASQWLGSEAALAFPVKLLTPQDVREAAERKAA